MYALLVEDDEALARAVGRGLESYGFHVQCVSAAEPAFELAAVGTFAVLIIDLMLPDMSGLQLLRALRNAGVRTPALCLTALGAVEDRVRGLDAGADDYLTKPFAFEELLARLRALLRRPAALIPAEALAAGRLRLLPRERLVTVDGLRVRVPPREFDLLEYLLRHAGRALSRDMLIDRVWGAHAEPRANVVDATVSRLRRRLRAAGWEGSIEAVQGLGYRLSPSGGRPTR